MKTWLAISTAWVFSALCLGASGCRDPLGSRARHPLSPPDPAASAAAATAAPAAPARVIAAHRWAEAHAPVIYQDIATNRHGGLADLPMRIDFDGDWDGLNNWESLDAAAAGARTGLDLKAYVYYAVVESETHVFIFYFMYHAQDWDDLLILRKIGLHEHDLEGLMVCVRKDPGAGPPPGVVEVMETQAHRHIYQYVAAVGVGPLMQDIDGPLHFDPKAPARARVYQQSKGHGVYGGVAGLSGSVYLGLSGTDFSGGDGFVYVYDGSRAEFAFDPGLAKDPNDGRNDDAQRRVSYELLPVLQDLWPRREAATSTIFSEPWDYFGSRYRLAGLSLAFRGDTHKIDASVTPWGHYDRNDPSVVRGDWFFDPALTISRHLRMPGPFSLNYVVQPYLGLP